VRFHVGHVHGSSQNEKTEFPLEILSMRSNRFSREFVAADHWVGVLRAKIRSRAIPLIDWDFVESIVTNCYENRT